MKTQSFIELTIAAGLLISAFFTQTAAAQSGKISQTKPAVCKVKKNNAGFFVSATKKTVRLKIGFCCWRRF